MLRPTPHFLRGAAAPVALTVLTLLAFSSVGAQEGGDEGLPTSALVDAIGARNVGSAAMSGRIVDVAVASSHGTRGGELGTVFYVASASGGVWKTTNGGASFTPVFDDAGVGSMGDVAVAPSNSNVVYVGTGEANNQRSSSYGDGVYRSLDGGESWEHVGLRTSQHVGRIVVHPEDPFHVYVAAVGPLWASGGERGLYRTTDGGESWEAILSVDEHTGVTDVVMHPDDPDILYAATFQRERRAYSYVGGGPGSGIWKSTDAGESWTRLTHGLPESDMGRIGLDISLSHPSTLYAVIESAGEEEGVYRTDDGGLTWRMTDDIASIPWYFGQIRVDPVDPETVYHLGVPLMRSEDGGVTWDRAARGGVHVDHHALWINPHNPDHLILGNDGGLYVSRDYGASWSWASNLPVSQFYAIGYDLQEPFYDVYGGLQDNSTWGGPSRTRYSMGIPNSLWFRMAGGDGFYAAIDPRDHTIAYVESQYGNIVRYDRRTGDRKGIQPSAGPGEEPLRWNWSAPIHISPHDPDVLYFAANHAFKSTDRGDSWTRLGEDLTRELDRDSLPMMGEIPDDDAVSRHEGTAVFGNVSTLDVSPHQPGLLVTGSDDGVIAVSDDDGQTWAEHTSFPGVPDTTYVSKVRWSKHDEDVLYATFDGHRSNDFAPYVLRSDDRGESWTSIASNLPEFGNVRAFAEHHANPDLLFVGTEIAPFVSVDGGASWTRIEAVPPSPVHDLKVHPRENDLVVGTHGRGIWIVDDLTPWQHLAEARSGDGPFLFPVEPAMAFEMDGSPTSGMNAARDYSADNHPVGTRISYLLHEGGGEVSLEILSGDRVVRTLDAPARSGLQQVHWNLRMEAPWDGPPEDDGGAGGGFGFFGGGGFGPLVVPGTYTARLTVELEEEDEGEMGEAAEDAGAPERGGARDVVLERSFRVTKDPRNRLNDAQLAELRELGMTYLRLNARVQMAGTAMEGVREALEDAEAALEAADADDALFDRVAAIRDTVESINEAVRGRGGFGGDPDQPIPDPLPIRTRLRQAAGVLGSISHMPTREEREALEAVPDDLEREIERLNEVITEALPDLRDAMDAAGVPWTPGRPIGGGGM